jgi:protein-L-isoaspartate O-methyltransferase
MDKKLTDISNRYITHPKDIEAFTDHPAPIMELIHSSHFTNINATDAYFGPMLYFLTRAFLCEKVLEIGTAEGYTSHYLAHAVNDNARRHEYKNAMFYGIDLVKTDFVREMLDKEKLPNTIIKMDSLDLTMETFKDIKFDLVFQDGCHDGSHVIHEFLTLWPQLREKGKGYWIFHDCYGPAEEAFMELISYLKNDNIEWIRLDDNIYGLAILRKMEGYDYERRHWTP